MTRTYDIAVMGSGFAGSIIAMIAHRLGLSVVMLEKGKHPRMMIGESSTPLSNLLLEQLADRYDLPLLRPVSKWGTWQQTYPNVTCGLKRGFSFFHHELGSHKDGRDVPQLLVAASPNDFIADTHWYRADFDQLLMQQAVELGVQYFDEITVESAFSASGAWEIDVRQSGQKLGVRAKFVVDATGPRGFLHRTLHLGERSLTNYLPTSALYSHFTGVKKYDAVTDRSFANAPYPVDAAALHHVFDGGWIWMLRFNNGVTSAGVAATSDVAADYEFSEGEAAWRRLLGDLPEVGKQFADSEAIVPFTFAPHLHFRSTNIVGEDWAMLPSAAGFVDPLLSTGFPLTLLGITRLADTLERSWGTPRIGAELQIYAEDTDGELLTTADLISALYANMKDFDLFRTLSLLYFAAASYSETVRRLDRPELASSFLLHRDPQFGPEVRSILDVARQQLSSHQKLELRERIYRVIAKYDVAGLGKKPANHCYPVSAADLFAAAPRLGASPQDIHKLLARAGFQ